jgi:UDP-N-acetylmuramate--alanine ligase
MIDSPVFFSGIGGSGMLPLASIVRAGGARVSGSDRSLGIQLFPQDGSGLAEGMTLVTSAAVEATVPDVVRAKELGLTHLTRPEFLAKLLNSAQRSVAVGGTSGKSTVTGMIGWILHACHRQPTVMNGAVMKNFVTPSAPQRSPRARSTHCGARERPAALRGARPQPPARTSRRLLRVLSRGP